MPPVRAAQQLEVELDGLRLPIDLAQLEDWSRNPDTSDGDLAIWLNLLDPADRASLIRLLRAPLIKERSFGLQLLNSWTGERMLQELGGLLTRPDGATTLAELDSTLRRVLERRGVVTALNLLEALPGESLVLRLDGLLNLAQRWRLQIQEQEVAMGQLHRLRVPLRNSRAHALPGLARLKPQRVELSVAHRPTPLPLELWPSRVARPSPWLVMMPGLGGNSTELSWLAASLSAQGWPVLVVEHPGSNGQAMRASLQGDLPPPGAESLPGRLADLQAVLEARRDGLLPPLGPPPAGEQGVVLVGHSLGGLTALMAAGLVPERGLGERCRQDLAALSLTNLSRLLQCQLPQVTGESSGGSALPDPLLQGSTRLRGVVAYNGFGSLLWPGGGLAALDLPVLLVGGSLDLVTPPVQEQLNLFQDAAHPFSRLVLVEGGSHFSPVRIVGDGKAVFRLGDELVGVEPRKVQELLLSITLEFLEGLDHPSLLPPQRRQQNGVVAYVLDAAQARRWSSLIRTSPADPAGPPAGRPAR
ncbi:alpha/beta hydrolase [Synechococcus sp. GFB01]|uniref:alpha/beta hydrolase n=1 Tax=Synechococcus sp. GFB01 TaxID=1662190 RepID=UPI001F1E5509|nr:alpha/beta hydrolase [Synechococcus sp. GFB01]